MPISHLQSHVADTIHDAIKGLHYIQENIRPSWLKTDAGHRLELDIFIPDLQIAVEVQGEQHYGFVPYFHRTYTDFVKRKALDATKRQLCNKLGIVLLEISCIESVSAVTKMIVDRSTALAELAVYP